MRIRIYKHDDKTRTYAITKARTSEPFTPVMVRGPRGTAFETFKGLISEVKGKEASPRPR